MKLTKDMFDFEKYDYHLCSEGGLRPGVEVFNIDAQRWAEKVYPGDSYNLVRMLKPPPRYILLNEGEPLKRGDECLEQGHSSLEWGPPVDHLVIGNVEAGEIWRRKVQE